MKPLPFYNPKLHRLVCPLGLYPGKEEVELTVKQIRQLGCKVIRELHLPVQLQYRFLYVQLPAWLSLFQDDDDVWPTEVFSFVDGKNRHRLRVMNSTLMPSTSVWTRYRPWTDHRDKFRPCVQDLELDADEDDEPKVIWRHKEKGEIYSLDEKQPAIDWLDKRFPAWRDPRAYWSKGA